MASPGEARWLNGKTEEMTGALKTTMKKIRNMYPRLDAFTTFYMALNAQSNLDRVKGFAPNQWSYGRFMDDGSDAQV